MRLSGLWILCVILSVSGAARAEEKERFPGVENLMTAEEYRAAGLDKLNAEERDALNRWLVGYTVKEAPVLRSTNEEVQEAEQEVEITANINEPFEGWTGKTVFYLDNGQIWRQRLSGKYRYTGDNRAVVIDKNFFGFWEMTLVETGKVVGVSRIK